MDILERLTVRNMPFGSLVLLDEAAKEIERLRALVEDACKVFDHYDLPEHAFHYRRKLVRADEQRGAEQ